MIGNVAVYFIKSSVYENLLSTILGRLALDNVFTGITTNQIVDVSGIVLYLSIAAIDVYKRQEGKRRRSVETREMPACGFRRRSETWNSMETEHLQKYRLSEIWREKGNLSSGSAA